MTDSTIIRMQRLYLARDMGRAVLRSPRHAAEHAGVRNQMVLIHWELRELEKRFTDFSDKAITHKVRRALK